MADDPTDDEDYIRLGITDESSKLDLNLATEEQLRQLVGVVVADDQEINPKEIVDAILDWRDADSNPRGDAAGGTEGEYYRVLDRPYRVKNGPFDTVEELLLVKGVTARILFGEDFDRNGLLTPNEDDEDDSFPPDNADGLLNRGLYPYLTVLSYEDNVSNDNQPRVYLFAEENFLREQLATVFASEPEVIDYIVEVTRGQGGKGEPAGGGDRNTGGGLRGRGSSAPPADGNTDTGGSDEPDKETTRQQYREDGSAEEADEDEEEPEDEEAPPDEVSEGEGDEAGEVGEEEESVPEAESETDDAQAASTPIRSPASLLVPRSIRGEVRPGPVGPEHLAVLLDRTTTLPPEQRQVRGLVNVNTAPAMVLRCLPGLTEEQITAILDTRGVLDSGTKSTPAWLVTEGIVDSIAFEQVSPYVTARGQQFTIESLGYADHIGMVSRLQVVVDMVGPIAQVVYYRDLTHLGGHYPIREEDSEKIRVQ